MLKIPIHRNSAMQSNHYTFESNQIMQALSTKRELMSIDTVMQHAGAGISKSTVLRRIDELRIAGLVERVGKGRATRYLLTEAGRQQIFPTTQQAAMPVRNYAWMDFAPEPATIREDGADLNTTGDVPPDVAERERLRGLVRRPLSQRSRCGYQRNLLDDYRPNIDYYLPETLRQELSHLGRSENMARLPAGTYIHTVFNRVLIDLAWNSSRLEGNTYSLLETDRLLALANSADPARITEARMILNHKDAIEFLVDAPDDIGFNRYTVLNLHALLSYQLLETADMEGRLRQIPVGIGGCAYSPESIPQVVEECFMQILEKASAIRDPLEASFFCMVHLPYLQPFVDVNKRVSRLVANVPLIRENMAPLTFADVPVRDYTDAILAVYELNRLELLVDVFARAYRTSAGRYSEVRAGTKLPDGVSVAYHEAVRRIAREVVTGLMNKATAAEHIRRWSLEHVAADDRPRVVELVEEGLLKLHDGSIAKYRVRPSEFTAWQAVWTGNP